MNIISHIKGLIASGDKGMEALNEDLKIIKATLDEIENKISNANADLELFKQINSAKREILIDEC